MYRHTYTYIKEYIMSIEIAYELVKTYLKKKVEEVVCILTMKKIIVGIERILINF